MYAHICVRMYILAAYGAGAGHRAHHLGWRDIYKTRDRRSAPSKHIEKCATTEDKTYCARADRVIPAFAIVCGLPVLVLPEFRDYFILDTKNTSALKDIGHQAN